MGAAAIEGLRLMSAAGRRGGGHIAPPLPMTFNTNPVISYLLPYAPRVTILPFVATLWFEGRVGFALALTLVWHFIVAVPWLGLPHFSTDADVTTAYFIVMPVIAAGFALLGLLLGRWLLHLPQHLTPIGHLLNVLFVDRCRPRATKATTIPLPSSYAPVSVAVSLLVVAASWLPSELLVIYHYSPSSISGALFWVNVFAAPGAALLPFVVWLAYGSKLKRIFGEKHQVWMKAKAFLKLFLVTAGVSVPYALVMKYSTHMLWLWVTAIIVFGGLALGAFIYHSIESHERTKDYTKMQESEND
jgi:hypothetical protein